MAAKPTPSVMPTKNFPSLVNFSRRGGRMRLRQSASQRSARFEVAGTGAPRSERDGDSRHDLAQGGLGLVAGRYEPVGVRGQTHAMGKDRDREVADVVGDAVAPAAEQGTRAGGMPERHGGA